MCMSKSRAWLKPRQWSLLHFLLGSQYYIGGTFKRWVTFYFCFGLKPEMTPDRLKRSYEVLEIKPVGQMEDRCKICWTITLV